MRREEEGKKFYQKNNLSLDEDSLFMSNLKEEKSKETHVPWNMPPSHTNSYFDFERLSTKSIKEYEVEGNTSHSPPYKITSEPQRHIELPNNPIKTMGGLKKKIEKGSESHRDFVLVRGGHYHI